MKLPSITKAKAAVQKATDDHGHVSVEARKAKKALRAARQARREHFERSGRYF